MMDGYDPDCYECYGNEATCGYHTIKFRSPKPKYQEGDLVYFNGYYDKRYTIREVMHKEFFVEWHKSALGNGCWKYRLSDHTSPRAEYNGYKTPCYIPEYCLFPAFKL